MGLKTVIGMTGAGIAELKLSELLRLAVADATAAEATEGVFLNMGTWLSWHMGTCEVCMAGAVMLRSLGIGMDPSYKYSSRECMVCPSSSETPVAARPSLLAIDYLRTGNVWAAAGEIGVTLPTGLGTVGHVVQSKIIHDYDPKIGRAKWSTYLEVAALLEAEGY